MRPARWVWRGSPRGALAACVLSSAAAVLAAAGCAGGDPSGARAHGATTGLPAGWHEIRRPITGVLYPTQVFAASTYPIVFHHRPESCVPAAALRQMPPDGVLLQVIEYRPTDGSGKRVRVPKLPPRPRRFSYRDAVYAPYECAGPSYKLDYRQGRNAMQAQIWMDRATVDSRRRAEALRILDRWGH